MFLRKHAPDAVEAGRAALETEQRARLLRHMVAGRCMPGDVGRLLAGLRAGFERGLARALEPHRLTNAPPPPFRRFATPPSGSRLIAGRSRHRKKLEQRAAEVRARGEVATLILLSPTALFHRLRFGDDGIWRQFGGVWGRSERNRKLFQPQRFEPRISAERERVAAARHL